MLQDAKIQEFVARFWDASILPTLKDYIAIPNVSPHFDVAWERAGHMQRALELIAGWLKAHHIPGSTLHVDQIPGRTPFLFLDIPGTINQNVIIYGHLDKQPEMSGWHAGLGAWRPVVREDKLYGRGGADDGYAVFSALAAVLAVRDQGLKHPHVQILIEFSEESGSPDLPVYIEKFSDIIGKPDVVICLDAGVGNYDQFWLTTSLRGELSATVRVDILHGAVHSGVSGVVPSSFRILRELLDRIEDAKTGKILIRELNAPIPDKRREQAKMAAQVLGESVYKQYPFVDGSRPVSTDIAELILNRTWRPTVSYLGIAGLPPCETAGNAMRPFTEIKLSFRLPPTISATTAQQILETTLTRDPPYGAHVSVNFDSSGDGWHGTELPPELEILVAEASQTYFAKPPMSLGVGGSIPFIGSLAQKFPAACFLVTGVLGPESNAHGPNEFLHLNYAKKLTACVAHILAKLR